MPEPTVRVDFHRFPQLTHAQNGSLRQIQQQFWCFDSFVFSKDFTKNVVDRLDVAFYEHNARKKRIGKRITTQIIYPKRIRWTTDFAYQLDINNERKITYGHFRLHGKTIYVCAPPLEVSPGKIRSRLTAKTRWAVLVRDRHTCVSCGSTPQDGAKLEVDHIVPVSKNGNNELANLRTLCKVCNIGKSDQYVDPMDPQ